MSLQPELLEETQNRSPSPEELRQANIEKQAQRIRAQILALRENGKDESITAEEADEMFSSDP